MARDICVDTEAEDWVDEVLNELGIDRQAPVRRIRPAAECPRPKAAGPRSIFEAGDSLPRSAGRGPGHQPVPWATRTIQVADGVMRRLVIRPQETAEWAEREEARRARQNPPRPTKRAKTMGKKLADLIAFHGE